MWAHWSQCRCVLWHVLQDRNWERADGLRGLTWGVHLQGIVTHMTDVKPLITVATYVEDDTGIEVYQPVIGATLRPS